MSKPRTPFIKRPVVRILLIWIIQTMALITTADLSVEEDLVGVAAICRTGKGWLE